MCLGIEEGGEERGEAFHYRITDLSYRLLGFLDQMIYLPYPFIDQTLSIQTYNRLELTEATYRRFGKYVYMCNPLSIPEPSSRWDSALHWLSQEDHSSLQWIWATCYQLRSMTAPLFNPWSLKRAGHLLDFPPSHSEHLPSLLSVQQGVPSPALAKHHN